MLEIRLLGRFEMRLDDEPVALKSRPARALLAFLLLHPNTPHPRDKLAGLLWPDATEANARRSLRQALWAARKALGPAGERCLRVEDSAVEFDARSDIQLDTQRLEAATAEDAPAADLLAAAEVYEGELLPGMYEDWVVLERERLQAAFERGMGLLLLRLQEAGRWPEVLDWAERWIALGQTPEPAYRALMRAHTALGDRASAAAAYQRCREALHKELGVEPSAETQTLYDSLARGEPMAVLPVPAANAQQDLPERHHNLPVELTSFVGRKREIAEVRRLLGEARLVTLVGAGGCGKTRLALRAASELVDEFADGVWLVELAALADPNLVPQAVASVLGVRESPGRPLTQRLLDYLRPRDLLLVLDNCEHLIEACARLAEGLLRGCPTVRLLATSREVLDIGGETAFQVPSLALPPEEDGGLPVAELLGEYDGVRLFAERAASALPGFALTDENAPASVQVCRRLDGMPLAIELAAARIPTLQVAQIAARLDDRFRLLTGGSRTAPPRHQTLRAMIDWSYGLLPAEERALLRRLAVFADGWTLEAVEAVWANDEHSALDLLTQLVNKSLVQMTRAPSEEARYWLLETVRQYAWDKLADSGEMGTVRRRHFEYFLELAERAERESSDPAEVIWLDRVEAEHDNLRAALDWSQSTEEQAESTLRLATALGRFWVERSFLTEGRKRLAAALAEPGAQKETVIRASAIYQAGTLAYWQGDFPAARSLYEESLAVARALGPAGRPGVAWALDGLGDVAMEVGEYGASKVFLQDSLALMRELNDKRGAGVALLILGWGAMRAGDYGSAAQPIEEALALFRELDNSRYIAMALGAQGEMALRLGEYEQAVQLLIESLTLRRQGGDKWGVAASLGTLGWAAMLQGNLARARSALDESLTVRQDIDDRGGMAWCLERLAEIALDSEEPERSARAYGAAAALREPMGSVIDPADQAEHDMRIAALRDMLGATGFAAAWEMGRVMPVDRIISEALRPG